MKLYYDLHIHTALSPCGDPDMTPNNIVNMALLKELDVIAVTDHNSAQNAEAVMQAAEGSGLLVIPGMEVETAEAVHVVCLFPDLESARAVERMVQGSLPPVKNRVDIFGTQQRMDAKDRVIGEEEQLLVVSAQTSIYELVEAVHEAGGIAAAAHVDRDSYSIYASLGAIPPDLPINVIEISQRCEKEAFLILHPECHDYLILQSSDAHYLEDIAERQAFIEADGRTVAEVFGAFKKMG